jgi:hypothetical protein
MKCKDSLLRIYVICGMKKMLTLFSVLVMCFGCKDEFNIPDYGTVVDDEDPTFLISSPLADSVYLSKGQLPIKLGFSDNYELGEVQFQMVPNNYAHPGYIFKKVIADSTFTLDTFYQIPATDSISYDVLLIVGDVVDNIVSESYTFATKD